MITLIRLAIAIFIGWWLFKLARGLLATAAKSSSGSGNRSEVAEMVQDPTCGSYISLDHALVLEKDGKTSYFCSEECRNKFSNS